MQNCVYAGLIKVSALKELPEKFVKSIHTAIISEAEYWFVQSLLVKSKRKTRIQPAEDFPLRGILKCWCGQCMTDGWTKGRRQYYLYYRCTTHTNVNIPGPILHEKFDTLLKSLSFQAHHLKFLIETSKTMLEEPLRHQKERTQQKLKSLQEINEKIYKLEERLMNNEIEASTYQTWFKKFKEEKAAQELSLNGPPVSKLGSEDELIEKLLPELSKFTRYMKKETSFKSTRSLRGCSKIIWYGVRIHLEPLLSTLYSRIKC